MPLTVGEHGVRPWLLQEANLALVRESQYTVAVIPFGATEPHNLHLPYGTDTYQVNVLGGLACEQAWRQGAKVVMLPAIPYGTETNLAGFPLAMNLNPGTLLIVLKDLLDSITASGIQKVVLLNGHGGNDLKPMLRELFGKTTAHLFLFDWYKVPLNGPNAPVFEHPDDHAGETETSFALAYFGALVAKTADGKLTADAGEKRPTRFAAINQGVVSITRPWKLLTTNSGAGRPHSATAEKGRKLVEYLCEKLSAFLVELASSPLDERFPY